MTDFLSDNLWIVWGVLALLLLAIELSSGDFFVTCFAVGCLAACGVSLIPNCALWVQLLIFAVGSILSLWLLRPALVKKLHKGGAERESNADAIIGRIGIVSETIEPDGYGRVKLDGDDWKAVSENGLGIAKGTKVEIVARESIIITVKESIK